MNKIVTFIALAILLAGCSGVKPEAKYPQHDRQRADQGEIYEEEPSIYGKDTDFFDYVFNQDNKAVGDNGLGVNSWLWRASLDTVSFLPIATADPFGGVITTDWYVSPEKPDERYKMNVLITEKDLKASALTVKLFKQEKRGNDWTDIPVADADNRKVEDAILTRARQIRLNAAEND